MCAAALSPSEENPDFKQLYESHLWFQLREAVNRYKAPLFYRAITESLFGKAALAEKDLRSVIESAPHSSTAYEARNALTSLFLRSGRYRDAWLENSKMLNVKPDEGDVQEMQGLLEVLSKYSDQTVIQRRPSILQYDVIQGNLFVPISINSKKAQYMLDTAATLSTISESEARRLNLTVHAIGSTADTGTGTQIAVQIAIASQFTIGNIHLHNVAFLITPDAQPPFNGLPKGQQGIIGLPVMLALRTVRWRSDRQMEIAFPSQHALQTPNLCFDDISLIARVKLESQDIAVVLDTGAIHSQLWPIFAKAFPQLLKQGKYVPSQVIGMAGSAEFPSVVLPSVTLRVGNKDTALAPAVVFLSQRADLARFYYGDLGLDLLSEARVVTIDFTTMTLSLQ